MRATAAIAATLLGVVLGLAQATAADQTPTARTQTARPTIVQRPIPFGAKRREEMRAYARRHYGLDRLSLWPMTSRSGIA